MCANCFSTGEAVVGQVMLAAAVLKGPAHRALASVGLADEPLEVARDARTVAFLRSLELDPDTVLGAHVVRDADAWVAQGGYESLAARRRTRLASWARPIGSHSRLAVQ